MGEMGVWVEKSNTTNAPKSKKRLTHIHRLMETRPAYTPPPVVTPETQKKKSTPRLIPARLSHSRLKKHKNRKKTP